ncbi:MAG: 4-amino-4-deoxychorismate lyase [Candidatus Nanopelagicales bacterium]|nr:4-amino-4-deoxychorismate lyase [Candidatus Nanopelagicales bacterium]
MIIWVGDRNLGSLVSEDEALISVLDHGFTVADGVFETMKVIDGSAFALTRHLRRLTASARAMGLADPDLDVIRGAVGEVLFANRPLLGGPGRLRITYTGGVAPLGSDRGAAVPTLVVALSPQTPWPETTTLVTVPWTRNENSAVAAIKTTSYADNVVALMRAHEQGASEAIFANTRGELCEGTGTNVFAIIGGQVLTPPLSSGCLAGVTRDLILEWFDVTEQVLDPSVLQGADEVFISSSTRDVHPVVRVDDRVWAAAGPVSTRMRQQFAIRAAAEIDP